MISEKNSLVPWFNIATVYVLLDRVCLNSGSRSYITYCLGLQIWCHHCIIVYAISLIKLWDMIWTDSYIYRTSWWHYLWCRWFFSMALSWMTCIIGNQCHFLTLPVCYHLRMTYTWLLPFAYHVTKHHSLTDFAFTVDLHATL